jgi:hypothetical protein
MRGRAKYTAPYEHNYDGRPRVDDAGHDELLQKLIDVHGQDYRPSEQTESDEISSR